MKFDKSLLVKKHFAETAKNMILANGVESISVRKVAKEAGYAYATIYNHFKNLDELLWLSRDLLIQDIANHLEYGKKDKTFDKTELTSSFLKYAEYYIENRNAFSFLYFHKLNKEFKYNTNLTEDSDFQEQYIKNMEELSKSEGISLKKAYRIYSTINYSIHGLLTLCFAENDQIKTENIVKEIKDLIESIME